MRERINDTLRAGIGALLWLLAIGMELRALWVQRTFRAAQQRLRQRYAVQAETPIVGYEAARSSIEELREQLGDRALEAQTSGSSSKPKRLLYSQRRLAQTRAVFIDVFARLFRTFEVRRKSLFVLAPVETDASLTTLLVQERSFPSRLACVQAPYRVERHPSLDAARAEYGAPAVRVWLLASCNPGVLYATNPSTLALFFDSLPDHWPKARRLARDFLDGKLPQLHATFSRVCAVGARQRLSAIADSDQVLPIASWMPGVEAFSCWDGGYVAPFLERVRRHLPGKTFLPMYSMSTEVVETVAVGLGRGPTAEVAFLPLAPGVLYELQPIDEPGSTPPPDDPRQLLAPWEAQPGRCYALVVSDAFGLKRYHTEDVFRCVRQVGGLPDLRFLRRRGLTWSFTGEKLTGEHLAEAFAQARVKVQALAELRHLACFPAPTRSDVLPHYVYILVGDEQSCRRAGDEVATVIDATLATVNPEFAAKRRTGRLGAPRLARVSPEEFVSRIGAGSATLDGQFKFLPLYTRPWPEP